LELAGNASKDLVFILFKSVV
jgi:hypothetical protein